MDKPFPTETVLLESIPNRCLMDNLESNFYVALDNGAILGLPIKSVVWLIIFNTVNIEKCLMIQKLKKNS